MPNHRNLLYPSQTQCENYCHHLSGYDNFSAFVPSGHHSVYIITDSSINSSISTDQQAVWVVYSLHVHYSELYSG